MATTNVGTVSMDLTLDSTKFDKSVKNKTNSTENAFSSSMKKVGGFIAGAFAVGSIVNFGKAAVNAASEVQSAWTGLNSIVQGTGNSFTTAQKFITDYTKDGLTTVTEATTAYKNLLSRGYDTTQIENTMTALKDSAAFGRQANYDLGEAIVTATEGLKNENSILVDNAGVTKNVAKMWEDWAKAHNTTTSAMTQAQKIEAEYNGILEETKFQTGDATTYTKTFGGQMQRLTASFTNMKVAIGQVITPIAQLFIPIINNAIDAITRFFNYIQKFMGAFGLKFNNVVSKGSANIASIGTNATESAKEAVKASKKINKAFSNVDEINVLNKSKSGTSGGSGSGGVSTPKSNNIDLSPITKETDEVDSTIAKLINRAKELSNVFKQGFDISFGDTNFDGIFYSLSRIKTSIIDIFTDSEVINSANNWVNNTVLSFGKITGSISKIGVNVVDLFFGSISNYLEQNSEKIKDFICNMFDISNRSLNITSSVWNALGEISDVFKSDRAKQIGADIIAIFTNPFMSLTKLFGKFTVDMYNLLVSPLINNVDKIKSTFSNLLTPIQTVFDTLNDAFTTFGDSINQVYDEHLAPFFNSLSTGLSDTFSKFLDVYNEYVAPFIEDCANSFADIWDNHLKPLWNNISEFIGNIIDWIKLFWEQWLKPVIDWIVQNIIPILVPIFSQIYNVISTVFKNIIDVINVVIGAFNGLITFVKGVFSGDWNQAWEGIKKVFSSIWDGIKNIVSNVINMIKNSVTNGLNAVKNTISAILNAIKTYVKSVTDGIWSVIKGMINTTIGGVQSLVNTVIKGLNKLIKPLTDVGNKVLSAVGIKNFSFSALKEITLPKLANGGYVEKNNPQLAIVGDNTREAEIVTPESKIYDQVDKAIKDNKSNQESKEIHMILEVRYEDGRKIIKKINQAEIDAGEILLLV